MEQLKTDPALQRWVKKIGDLANDLLTKQKGIIEARDKIDAHLKGLSLKRGGIGSSIKMIPDRVLHVKAGEMKRFPVYISVEGLDEHFRPPAVAAVDGRDGGKL